MATPNMNLTLPVVSQTPGPTWASTINADLSLIDSHNHTSGNGALVPVAGLDIDADLSLATHALTDVTKAVLLNQASVATSNAVYAKAGDLWWTNGGGTPVQVTSGGSVFVGGTGNIGGLPNGSAAVNYVSGPLAYEFLDENGNEAALLGSTVGLYNLTLSRTPGSSTYTLRFPISTPAAPSFVTATVSGSIATMSFSNQTGYVTKAMQAPVGQQIQSSASSYSVSSSTPTSISDTITITTNGRPVVLGVNSSGSSSCLEMVAGGNGPIGAVVWFSVTGSAVASVGYQNFQTIGVNTEYYRIPSSSVLHLWTPAAGTYNIQMMGYVATGGSYVPANLSMQSIKIYAYEL